MLLCFAFFGVARAEVVEIGDASSTNTQYYIPFNMYYNYSLSQQIYPACEIGTAGTINSIAFEYTYSSAFSMEDVQVYMMLTDKDNFETTTDMVPLTNATLVYEGTFAADAAGWVTITLDTPFVLDGTNNLLVCCYDPTSGYASYNHKFRATSTTTNYPDKYMAITYYSDGTCPNLNDVSTFSGNKSRNQYRNNIQLDITPDPSVTLCCPPDAITVPTEGITAHEAVVNWEGGSAPYNVEYKKTTETEWTVGATGVTGLTTTLTNLTQNTTYQARVQSGCGSAWVISANFTTLVSVVAPTDLTCTGSTTNSATLSWTENGTATEWIVAYKTAAEQNFTEVTVNNNPNTTITSLTHSTTYTAKVCAVVDGERSSWSSTINFNTACDAITSFPWSENFESYASGNFTAPCWVNEHISGDGTQIFKVYSSTSGIGGNTTKMLQLPDQTSGTMTKLVLPEMTLPENYEFSIDVYRSNSTYSPENNPYEGIRIYASTDGEIEGATELAFIPRQFDEENGSIPAENAAGWYTYELPLGMSGTCYIILRGENRYCTSTYMDNFIVKEVPACFKPTGLAASNVNGHGATITWTSDAAAWEIQLGEETPIDVTEPTYTFTGLDPETAYSVKVRSNCDGVYSEWTDPVSFTTTVACPAPTALTVALTPGNGSVAALSWTENGTATEWDVEYSLDAAFAEFRVVNVENTPSTTLEGLTPETQYYARVKTYCGTDGYSLYSNIVSFTPTDALSLTVNDGTATNSQVPVYGLWVDSHSKSQFIIPAADLADMTNSIITKITFHSSSANVAWGAAQFEVYVAEVENTTFEEATLVDWASMTKVRNAGSLSIVDNKMVVELTSPYQYMGGNLMIGILETTVGTYSSCSWYGVNQETEHYTAIGGYETSKALSRYAFLPKTTFTYEEMPNCFATNLTIEPAAESADLTWTSENTNFDIWYRELSEGLTYDFEQGIGDWTTIDADGDGFDWQLASVLMAGYSIPSHGEGEDCVSSQSYDSDAGALTPDNYLVSPQITLGGSITFWAQAQDASYAAEHFGVAVSTTGNTDAADFTTIAEWTMTAKSGSKAGNGNYMTRSGNRASGNWYQFTVDLSAYSGQGYVAIRHFNCSDMFYLNVDDISIVEPSQENPWTEKTSATNSYTITGLTPETQYEVQVRANCGDDEYSEWMYDTFWTTPLCEAPTSASVETGTDYITLSWVSEADAFDIYFDGDIFEEGYEGYTYTFENLDPGTYYTVGVRTNCRENGTSDWIGGEFMTDCEAFDLPYEYNFDDMLTSNTPDIDCWTVYSWSENNEIGYYYQDDEHTGIMIGFGSTYPDTDYDQILISPELNTEAPVTVSFDYRPNRYDEESHIESFMVGYMTSMEEFDVVFVDAVEATNPDEFTTYTTTLPAGTKYVVVYYTGENPYTLNGGYYSYLFVDNFVFEEAAEGPLILYGRCPESEEAAFSVYIDDPRGEEIAHVTMTGSEDNGSSSGNDPAFKHFCETGFSMPEGIHNLFIVCTKGSGVDLALWRFEKR